MGEGTRARYAFNTRVRDASPLLRERNLDVKRTSWWTNNSSSLWTRIRSALHRDWLQTQLHFGASHCFDLKQNFKHTLLQALGRQSIPVGANLTGDEKANRFGVAARHHYADVFPDWGPELERELRREWGKDFDEHQEAIKRGWESQIPQRRSQPDKVSSGRKIINHGVRFDPADPNA